MVGSGDDFLHSVLGGGSYAVSGSPTPQAPPSAGGSEGADEIAAASAQARAGEQTRYEANQVDSTAGIGASISGQAFAQLGQGGGYSLDPDQLAARIRGVEEAIEVAKLAERDFWEARDSVYSPTTDASAVAQAESARRYAEGGLAQAESIRKFLQGWVDGARKALGTYQVHEDDAAQDFERQQPSGGDGSEGTGSLLEGEN